MNIDLSAKVKVEGSFELILKDKDGNVLRHLPETKNVITELGYSAIMGWGETRKLKDFLDTRHNQSVIGDTSQIESRVFGDIGYLPSLFFGQGTGVPNKDDKELFEPVGYCDWLDANAYTITKEAANEQHPHSFKTSIKKKFVFNVYHGSYNLTELGLGNFNSSSNLNFSNFEKAWQVDKSYATTAYSAFFLLTHSMIKDEEGKETTISISPGEILECYYTVSLYFNDDIQTGTCILKYKDSNGNISTEEFETKVAFLHMVHENLRRIPMIPCPCHSYSIDNMDNIYIVSEEALEGHDFTTTDLNDWITGTENKGFTPNDFWNTVKSNYTNIIQSKIADEYKQQFVAYNIYHQSEWSENGEVIKGQYKQKTFTANYLLDNYYGAWYCYKVPQVTESEYSILPDEFKEFASRYPSYEQPLSCRLSILYHPNAWAPKGFTQGKRIRGIAYTMCKYTYYGNNIEQGVAVFFKSKTTGRGIPKNNKQLFIISIDWSMSPTDII